MKNVMLATTALVMIGAGAMPALAGSVDIDTNGSGYAVTFLQGFGDADGKAAALSAWGSQNSAFASGGFAVSDPDHAPGGNGNGKDKNNTPAHWSADHAEAAGTVDVSAAVSAWLDSVSSHSGNSATIEGDGDDNSVTLLQAGADNTATLTQDGDDNEAYATQATDGGTMTLGQDGDNNSAYAAQVGSITATTTITQGGNDNNASVIQMRGATDGVSIASIVQTGNANTASILAQGTTHADGLKVTQSGSSVAMLAAYGDGNKATVTQSAASGWVNLYISGETNTVSVTQGADADAAIALAGNSNSLTMTQDGSGSFGSVVVSGNTNALTLEMAAAGALVDVAIDGNSNTVTVSQSIAALNAITKIDIDGNDNLASVTQTAENTEAEIAMGDDTLSYSVTLSQSVAGATADLSFDGRKDQYKLRGHSVANVTVSETGGRRSYTIAQF
jgi:hypothetical protein